MPELPEVQTTVASLQKVLPKRTIVDVWTDFAIKDQKTTQYKNTLKDKSFFGLFKKLVHNKKITQISRRGKNILIQLETEDVVLIHMKMTGHLLYGDYKKHIEKNKISWEPIAPQGLKDPFNRFIHVVFKLDNNKYLALCDSRKFAKVALIRKSEENIHIKDLGPEPLDKTFTYNIFTGCINKKPQSKIKTVLLDQSIISGIGNIYSDEALWLAGIHPEEQVKNINEQKRKLLYKSIKVVLTKGIDFGGDSTSDYRNIDGLPGQFHHAHNAYRLTRQHCKRKNCLGYITRKVVGGRSSHYCDTHQKLLH